ncbi:hypothetical protein KY285_016509 [Solanum tuberosum]|nr:hypothetical protein KY284_016513 [Solanum tuberosum]KAH0702231.1 hypothetical protein KY285_016509 [Solanum tuberosum]
MERVEKISRLYMLVILGGILLPNTSGNLISLQYLAFLDPIHDVGKYSWGSAVSAYLYRALCRASIGNVVDICGFIPLLQVWCWERILHVQPSTPMSHDGDVLLPYARRWTCGIDRDTESHHVLISIRDQLDHMTKDHDLPVKKRKRDNEDEDGYTGLRPRDVLRISRKGCGT